MGFAWYCQGAETQQKSRKPLTKPHLETFPSSPKHIQPAPNLSENGVGIQLASVRIWSVPELTRAECGTARNPILLGLFCKKKGGGRRSARSLSNPMPAFPTRPLRRRATPYRRGPVADGRAGATRTF